MDWGLDGASVLIVEDDPDARGLLSEVLSQEGYAVEVAANGRDALVRLGCLPRPCLVLLDLNMPVMSGHSVLEELERWDRSQLKVLVVTAGADRIAPRAQLWIAGRMQKPVDLGTLLDVVRTLLPTRE